MLPPTCTKLIPSASGNWTSRAKSLFTLPTKKGKAGKGKGGARATAASKGKGAEGEVSTADSSQADQGREKAEASQVSQQVCSG